jgi:ADP-ribose pyrophosphatase YjhB (NUDIX family)
MAWSDRPLRILATAAHQLVRLANRLRRPRSFGAHAAALTPERKLILVKLRYAPGWRLPGGGHSAGEDARDAVLRELREEIGMTSHGKVTLAAELEERPDRKRDLASVFIVENVRYAASWSWEVERILEAPLHTLPDNLAPVTARWLAALGGKL